MRYGYNFGDEIVPWLFHKMFNFNLTKPCSKLSENILLSIGSLLWASNSSSTIWGTGILSNKELIAKPREILSVRGLFSRQRLLDLGYSCPKTFGDPAILCKNYYYPKVTKKYTLGIIPHIVDYNNVYNQYSHVQDIKIIDLRTNNIEKVITEILSCEKTISSALHGIIISIIYNIPTKWVIFSNLLYGDNIKFYDFFSSLDEKVFNRFNYDSFRTGNEIYNPTILINSESDQYSIKKIDTILYSTKNIQYDSVYKSCPI